MKKVKYVSEDEESGEQLRVRSLRLVSILCQSSVSVGTLEERISWLLWASTPLQPSGISLSDGGNSITVVCRFLLNLVENDSHFY